MLCPHVHLASRRCPSAPVVPSGGSGEALNWVTLYFTEINEIILQKSWLNIFYCVSLL